MRKPNIPFLFFLSGASGLIYEVVWMRMLIRVFGITLYATSTIISVYMGGLALGSWAMGSFANKKSPSLKLYGVIELGIAASALLATAAMNKMPILYALLHSHWDAPIALRLSLSALVLILPTFLMGTTLPLLSQWITRDKGKVGMNLGFLYGLNTLGAVVGVLWTGFFSIGLWGEKASIWMGLALNVLIAMVILLSTHTSQPLKPTLFEEEQDTEPRQITGYRFFLGLAIASGFCALAYEVIWTRILILILGSSIYAFSAMLSVYLAGIALGSLIVTRSLDRWQSPVTLFAALEIALAALGIGSLWVFRALGLSASSPEYLYSPLQSASDCFRLFWMSGLVILPLTLLLGAIFPLLGRLVAGHVRHVGKSVGALYAWNTLGGVLGSLLTGFCLIPWIGTQASFCLISVVNLLIGIMAVMWGGRLKHGLTAAAVLGSTVIVIELIPHRTNIFLEILSRRLAGFEPGSIMFHREDAQAAITGYRTDHDDKLLLINGIITSGKGVSGELMAHLPLVLHPHPSNALVICFGAGNTFRSATNDVNRVDAVELVGGVVKSFSAFYDDADQYLSRPGVKIFINDGRNHLLLSQERHDVIIVDASPPIFSAGTVNLYSREFLELARARLTESGIMCLWVPLPCFESDFWMITRNFEDTFPHVLIWSRPGMAGLLVMGSTGAFERSPRVIAERIRSRGFQQRAPWFTPELIQSGFILSEAETARFSRPYASVTDDRPYTEFPLQNFLAKRPFWMSPEFVLKAKRNDHDNPKTF